jgi:hypothetical protein
VVVEEKFLRRSARLSGMEVLQYFISTRSDRLFSSGYCDVDYGTLHAEEGGMMKFESLDIRGTGSRGRLRFLDLPSLLEKVAFAMA